MLTRDDIYRSGLPLMEQWVVTQYMDYTYKYRDSTDYGMVHEYTSPILIVGPTMAELSQYAPTIAAMVETYSNQQDKWVDHCPITCTDDLTKNFESLIRSDRKYDLNRHLLLSLPPEIGGDWIPAGRCQRLTEPIGPSDPPSLVFASLVPWHFRALVLLPTTELDSIRYSAYREGIVAMARRSIEFHSTPRLRRDVLHSIVRTDDQVVNEQIQEETVAETLPQQIHASGFLPRLIWKFQSSETDCAAAFVELYVAVPNMIAHPCTHLRHLPPEMVADAGRDPDLFKALYEVACGLRSRNEDDVFVPFNESLRRASWTDNTPATPRPYESYCVSQGIPSRTVGSLCKSIEELRNWTPGDASDDTLWFVQTNGWFAVKDRAPSPPARPAELDKCDTAALGDDEVSSEVRRYRSDVKVWQDTRVFRLTVREDAEYLLRLLNDARVRQSIQCRSMGSLDGPVVSRRVIEETEVPWPRIDRRRSDLATLRSAIEVLKTLDADEIKDAAELFAEQCEDITDRAQAGDYDDLSPLEGISAVYQDLIATYEGMKHTVDNSMKTLTEIPAVADLLSRPDPTDESSPPALLAILQRRLTHERDPRARVGALLDLAEATVVYDAVVLLSALGSVNQALVATAFSKAVSSKLGRRQVSMAWGDWNSLATQARQLLKHANVDEHLLPLKDRTVGAVGRKLNHVVRQLVEIRNDLAHRGHGLHRDRFTRLADDIQQHVDELQELLQYVNEFPLFVVEHRTVAREQVTLHARMLVQDNQDFGVVEFNGPRGGSYDLAADGETYLRLARPDGILSLHPWVVFGTDQHEQQDAIWILDGFDRSEARYRCPYLPGCRTTRNDLHPLICELAGI